MDTDLARPPLVADFLITECRDRGDPPTNLKLQKLLYYAQAWHLALYGKEVFAEDFEAWVHGPVLPSQYFRFRDNRWHPIMDKVHAPMSLALGLRKHLLAICDEFGSETATALERMTHREKPWRDARRGLPATFESTSVITKSAMKEYYRTLK